MENYNKEWYEITKAKLKNTSYDELLLSISLGKARIDKYKAELQAAEDLMNAKFPGYVTK